MGAVNPFMDCIQQMRPHQGQIETGAAFRKLLEGSEIIKRRRSMCKIRTLSVASAGAERRKTLSATFRRYCFIEINSVTDNPTIFPDEDLIISATSTGSRLPFLTISLPSHWRNWETSPNEEWLN